MSIRMEQSPVTSSLHELQQIDNSKFQPAPLFVLKRYEEGLQSYNKSSLLLDLNRQPPQSLRI